METRDAGAIIDRLCLEKPLKRVLISELRKYIAEHKEMVIKLTTLQVKYAMTDSQISEYCMNIIVKLKGDLEHAENYFQRGKATPDKIKWS